jgi:putative toxin-antitoxin system antitoxin component (TIGR02293 family)
LSWIQTFYNAVMAEDVKGAQSGPYIDMESIVKRLMDVIGNREEAMRWLGTPIRALDYATPISRLHDPAGKEQVLAVLTQLEHGVL